MITLNELKNKMIEDYKPDYFDGLLESDNGEYEYRRLVYMDINIEEILNLLNEGQIPIEYINNYYSCGGFELFSYDGMYYLTHEM